MTAEETLMRALRMLVREEVERVLPQAGRAAADADRVDLPELATRKQVAEDTQTSIPTLARWAADGEGPKTTKLGGAVRYRREDVLAWIRGEEVQS